MQKFIIYNANNHLFKNYDTQSILAAITLI